MEFHATGHRRHGLLHHVTIRGVYIHVFIKAEPTTSGPVAMQQFNWLIKPKGTVTVVNQSGVITNVGYPLSYETGTKHEWVIELEGGSEVVFTNISLNEYEHEVSGQKALSVILLQ